MNMPCGDFAQRIRVLYEIVIKPLVAGRNQNGVEMKALRKSIRFHRVSHLVHAIVTVFAVFAATDATAQGAAPNLGLAIEIDPSTGAFSAEARIEAPIGDVMFPAVDWLSVDAVEIAQSGDSLAVLPDAYRVDQDLHGGSDLRVVISGTLPPPERTLTTVAWSPEAVYAIWPAWFPTDDTAIRDHDLSVIVPVSHRIAATGSLVSDEVNGEGRQTRYVFTGRSSDLGVFVGPYVMQETGHRDQRLRTYFEAHDADLSERYFAALATYLDRYTDEVGEYTYDGFSVVSAPIPVSLGFAGLTYVSRDILGHPYMAGRSLAHEVLHSWWGNAVGVDYATDIWPVRSSLARIVLEMTQESDATR